MCAYHAGSKRTTKVAVAKLLREEYELKADLKEKELELRRQELELQKKKLHIEEKKLLHIIMYCMQRND